MGEAGDLPAGVVQQQHVVAQRQRGQGQVVGDGVGAAPAGWHLQPPQRLEPLVEDQQLTVPGAVHQPAATGQRQDLADALVQPELAGRDRGDLVHRRSLAWVADVAVAGGGRLLVGTMRVRRRRTGYQWVGD
jgi:hypothetical protein